MYVRMCVCLHVLDIAVGGTSSRRATEQIDCKEIVNLKRVRGKKDTERVSLTVDACCICRS